MVCPGGQTCGGGVCRSATVLGTFAGVTWYRVPVSGTMSDTNIANACANAGLIVPCNAGGCPWSTTAGCRTTSLEQECGNPMRFLARALCNTDPPACSPLNGVYQWMAGAWSGGGGCGADMGSWCSTGSSMSNRFALCVNR